MKTKIISLLAAITIVLGILSGCASNDAAAEFSKDSPAFTPDMDESSRQSDGTGGNFAPDVDPGSLEPAGKMIIYTANISVEVDNVRDAIDAITAKAVELGGFVSGSDYRNNDRVSGRITVRVPPAKLGELSEQVADLGEVLSNTLSSEDVTYDYVDLEARLKNAEAQEKQLLSILEMATEIEDILAVRSELNQVQQEIEVYKGQLRYLDNMVDYSTVTVTLTEIYVPQSPEADADKGLLARWDMEYIGANITKGFKNSLTFVVNAFGVILIVLSYILVPLLIVGAVIFVILLIVKKSKKRARKNSIPPAPARTAANAPKEPGAGPTPKVENPKK